MSPCPARLEEQHHSTLLSRRFPTFFARLSTQKSMRGASYREVEKAKGFRFLACVDNSILAYRYLTGVSVLVS